MGLHSSFLFLLPITFYRSSVLLALLFFSGFFAVSGRSFAVSTFVPLVEHGRDAAFPVLAPRAVAAMMAPAVAHSAEEHHLHEAEEEEQQENAEADPAEREKAEVSMAMHSISVAIRRKAVTIHHGRYGLPIFSGLCNGGCHSRGL